VEQFAKGPPAEEVQAARSRVAAARAAVKDAREQLEKAVFRADADGVVLVCNARAALPGKEFKGTVTWVAPAAVKPAGFGAGAGGGSGSAGQAYGGNPAVAVKIKPAGPVAGLRPGYTADLTITTRIARQAVVIPHEAVREENGQKWVYVISDGRAVRREIKTGTSNELYVEVTAGVQKGEKVIVNPPQDLPDGRAVKEAEKAGRH